MNALTRLLICCFVLPFSDQLQNRCQTDLTCAKAFVVLPLLSCFDIIITLSLPCLVGAIAASQRLTSTIVTLPSPSLCSSKTDIAYTFAVPHHRLCHVILPLTLALSNTNVKRAVLLLIVVSMSFFLL
jgi:hypothetical protein